MNMEYSSDYQRVKEFNETFGVPVFETPQEDIFISNPKLVKLRLDLIREELTELEEAVKNHDMIETIDALADIIYVVQGMGCSLGIDMDNAFDIVHKSNMSKLCKTEAEAEKTVEFYKARPELGYKTPSYKLSANKEYYIVFNKDTGKILKSINYVPASFVEMTMNNEPTRNL